jgi:rfaE bifunctional protein kinase chain/domain
MITEKFLTDLFNRFNELTVTVAGDVMADIYLEGKVNRISPEAPVPVVELTKKYVRPGGAGNVAVNLQSLGCKVNLCSVIGDDENGRALTKQLTASGIGELFLLKSGERITTSKSRVIGNQVQMLRIDEEDTKFLSENEYRAAFEKITAALESSDALLFQDYDKGYLSPSLIENATNAALQKEIPIAVDPKVRSFFAYKNCTLFKPNLKEMNTGLNKSLNYHDVHELQNACTILRRELNHTYTLLTLSEKGIYGESRNEAFQIPAHVRNIADVSGAGDTVIAVATLCLAAGADFKTTAAVANLAGGLVCEWPGVVPVNKTLLLNEAIKTLVAK